MSDIPALLLDTPVSDPDVTTIAAEYLTSWEELSPFLNLTKQHETDIRKDFTEHSNQKRQALLKWKMINGDAATYRAFITAATKASNMELADKVKAMLRTKEKPTGKTNDMSYCLILDLVRSSLLTFLARLVVKGLGL